MPAKKIFVLTAVIFQIFTAFVFAQPDVCPDLFSDCFIDFLDFAPMAENWQQTGQDLQGDFDANGIVDIKDLDFFTNWWLLECNNPPDFNCPDCIYPDCNLTDCNMPICIDPCPYCDKTPPYLVVTITDHNGCGCIGHCEGGYPTSNNETGNMNGTYLVPYFGRPLNSYCEWRGYYDQNNYTQTCLSTFDCDSACYPPVKEQPVCISITRGFDIADYVDLCIGDCSVGSYNCYKFYGITENITNCYEGSFANEIECGNIVWCDLFSLPYREGPLWGGGAATISLPTIGDNLAVPNEDELAIKLISDEEGDQVTLINQKDLFQLHAIATSWLKE